MAEILLSKLNTLPATADANELLFIKNGSLVSMYITDVEGTPVGVIPAGDYVKQVNGSGGTVQLNLTFSGGKLGITGGNQVNLDNRYFKSTDHINWSAVDLTPTTLAGYGISDAYTKSESDAITGLLSNLNTSTKTNLVSAINELLTSINEGMRTPEPIDCSTNPDYPASEEGDTYKVTAAGKIGGENGKEVEVNDTIICTATNGGGDQAAVGGSFYVIQGNITDATTSVKGLGRIATQAEVNAGNEDQAWVTPSTMSSYLSSNYYTKAQSDGRYLQSFTETDPVWEAEKTNYIGIGKANVGTFAPGGAVDLATQRGTFVASLSFADVTSGPAGIDSGYGYLLNIDRSDNNSMNMIYSSTAKRLFFGVSGSNWKEVALRGDNISNFNNDAGYLTAGTMPTPTLQQVTTAGSSTNNIIRQIGSASNSVNIITDIGDGNISIDATSVNSQGWARGMFVYSENPNDPSKFIGTQFGAYQNSTLGFQYGFWTTQNDIKAGAYNSELSMRLYPDGSLWYGTPPVNASAATKIFTLGSDGHTISTRTAAEVLADIGGIANNATYAADAAGTSLDASALPNGSYASKFTTSTVNRPTTSGAGLISFGTGIYTGQIVIGYGDDDAWYKSQLPETSWLQFASREWVTSQNYLTSLPIATSSVLGGIKVGSRLSITAQGTMSADKQTDNNFTDALLNKLNGISAGANNYTLPVASTTTLGGVKLGVTMVMNGQAINAKTATSSQAGIVKPGGNMAVDAQGTITAQWKEVEW